jgi:hypothetical protein
MLEPPFSDCRSQLGAIQVPKMPDQAPASIDSWRPAKGWRYANYRGVGGVELVATAVAAISQLTLPFIKCFTVGASVGVLTVLLEMVAAIKANHWDWLA